MTRAIVLGGGFAGMCAAQVLSATYSKVILVEATRFDPDAIATPQAHHLHVLLSRGRLALERIFPGLDQDLEEAGCPEIDWGLNTIWISRAGEFPRYRSGIVTRSASRLLMESCMRKRILTNRNIETQDKAVVDSLLLATNAQVEGIRLKDGREIYGDFFVNAMGRRNPLARKDAYEASRMSIFYSSCFITNFCLPRPIKQFYMQMRPRQIGLVITPVEEGRFIATLLSDSSAAAKTQEEFLSAIKTVDHHILQAAVTSIEFVAPVKNYHHEKGRRLTKTSCYQNLVTIGDADCCFNPVYGQGMTIAALAALKLPHYGKNFRKIHKMPWMIAKAEDAAFHRQLSTSIGMLVARVVFACLLSLAVRSRTAHRFFLEVLHMRRPLDRGILATLLIRRAA